MNNKIEVFKNEQFGEVRTILEGETLLFCGSDIAKALGYARPGKAIIDHCKGVLKRDTPYKRWYAVPFLYTGGRCLPTDCSQQTPCC